MRGNDEAYSEIFGKMAFPFAKKNRTPPDTTYSLLHRERLRCYARIPNILKVAKNFFKLAKIFLKLSKNYFKV
jgi:hypothetical protein